MKVHSFLPFLLSSITCYCINLIFPFFFFQKKKIRRTEGCEDAGHRHGRFYYFLVSWRRLSTELFCLFTKFQLPFFIHLVTHDYLLFLLWKISSKAGFIYHYSWLPMIPNSFIFYPLFLPDQDALLHSQHSHRNLSAAVHPHARSQLLGGHLAW